MKIYVYRVKLKKMAKIWGKISKYIIVRFTDRYIEEIFKQYDIPYEILDKEK